MKNWLFWISGNLIGWVLLLWADQLGETYWAILPFAVGGTIVLATNLVSMGAL